MPRRLMSGPPTPSTSALATAVPTIDGPTTSAPQAIAQPIAVRVNGPLMRVGIPADWHIYTHFLEQNSGGDRRQQGFLQCAGLAVTRIGADEGEAGDARDSGQRRNEKVTGRRGPEI